VEIFGNVPGVGGRFHIKIVEHEVGGGGGGGEGGGSPGTSVEAMGGGCVVVAKFVVTCG